MPGSIRYCPQCAHPVEDRQVYGKVRQVCPQCGYIHFFDPKVAAVVFIERITDNTRQVLLVRRGVDPEKGRWALPAGFVDHGEDPKLAAVRETAEETGLHVVIGALLDVYFNARATIAIVYAAQVVGGTLIAGDDAAEVGWFSAAALPDLAFESTQQLVARWANSMPGTAFSGFLNTG